MAAFRDDMPLVAGVNADWDENTTGTQIMRPDWDFSPIRMRTMHHLPQIFFDTLRPERPDCPVLIPSSFSVSRDRVMAQDIYSYEPCGLPTGNFMPAEKAQMRLMTASPITLRACIPAPDQVTPERAYFKDLDFYKKTPSERPRPAVELPRPRASSAPPSSHPAKRMALNYLPVTEEITPPITPPRAQAKEIDTGTETVPETPSPIQKPGRSRAVAHGAHPRKLPQEWVRAARQDWRNSGDGAQAPSPDITENIQQLTRELRLCDVPRNVHKELQRVLPSVEEEMIRTLRQPPAAGLMTRHHDTYYIPPPRAVGGVRGNSAPVSTAMLGLIHRQDPSLAAQLREDPGSMMTQATRRSTMRLIRTGMLGQLASLQQWEEAMHRQDDM